jgi:lactoylglutathione lyase
MYIDHVAIWTKDLERLKDFYSAYFGASVGPKYHNPAKNFESYFLEFPSGSRIELMQRPEIPDTRNDPVEQFTGYIHVAFAVEDEAAVDALTETLRRAGYPITGEPRHTGDGYYESHLLDPDGNRVELVASRKQ